MKTSKKTVDGVTRYKVRLSHAELAELVEVGMFTAAFPHSLFDPLNELLDDDKS